MVEKRTESLLTEFGLEKRRPPELFRAADEVGSAILNGYTHVLRRAWKSFRDLVGVLSVAGRPTVYLQYRAEHSRISVPEQQRFWSHGVAPILVRVTPEEVQIYSGLKI